MPRRVFSSPLSKLCFWGFTWIPFRCRPVWLLPDFQFPLQARPSCLSEYLPQVARPHGSGLPCAAPRVAPHEAVPLVDESAEDPPHGTSYSPNQGVAQRHFSPEWSQNGCVSPSPYDYDGRIDERLGQSFRGQTGARGMDRRVPFLAHKLPGAQSCLPGFDSFSPHSWETSCNSQDGQHGGSVPHKSSGGFTVAHPGQACAPSSPLVPGQVPFLKGSSRSGNLEPRSRLSVETETQAGRVDVEPSDSSPDLGSVWKSGSGTSLLHRSHPNARFGSL